MKADPDLYLLYFLPIKYMKIADSSKKWYNFGMNNSLSTIREYPTYAKGTVLLVNFDFYRHWGIADGNGGVISASNSKGEVVHEPAAEFADNREIVVNGNVKYAPNVAAYERMKKQLGTSYNLLEWNCEHLVNWAFGFKPESKQVEVALTATGAAIGYGMGKTWQGAAIGGILGLLLAKISSNNNRTQQIVAK